MSTTFYMMLNHAFLPSAPTILLSILFRLLITLTSAFSDTILQLPVPSKLRTGISHSLINFL